MDVTTTSAFQFHFSNVSPALNVNFEEIFEPSLHTASECVSRSRSGILGWGQGKKKVITHVSAWYVKNQATKSPYNKELLTITAILT